MKNRFKYTLSAFLIGLIAFSACSRDDTLYIDAKDVLKGEWYYSYEQLQLECYPELYKDTLKSYYLNKYRIRANKNVNVKLKADSTFVADYEISYGEEEKAEGQISGNYDYSNLFFTIEPQSSTSSEIKLEKTVFFVDTLSFDRVKLMKDRSTELIKSSKTDEFWQELGIPKPEKFSVLGFRQYTVFKKLRDL